MQVREIMTNDPVCCSSDSSIKDAAQLMIDHDCGEIPVLDDRGKLAGVVTDRDIACRAVAQGRSPETPVAEVMSSPAHTVTQEMSVEDCCKTMEDNQIRRVPVVDESGSCCGIVSQGDIARNTSEEETAELVRDVSEPTSEPSRVGCC